MGISSYHMYCTVCKSLFGSRAEWITHLPEIGHQRRARLGCRRWNKSTKECVLVAFSSCPIEDCDLARRLSFWDNLVTDFVWWRKKPNVGLVQFESRKKLEDVLQRTNAEVKVGDTDRVQLKKAADYLELEWNVMLSLKTDSRIEPESEPSCDLYDTIINGVKHEVEATSKSCDTIVVNAMKKRTTSTEGDDGLSHVTPKKIKKTKDKSFESDITTPATESNKPKKKKSRGKNDNVRNDSKKVKKSKSATTVGDDNTTPKKTKKAKSSTLCSDDKRKRPKLNTLHKDSEALSLSHRSSSCIINSIDEPVTNNVDNQNHLVSFATDNLNIENEPTQLNLNSSEIIHSRLDDTSDNIDLNTVPPISDQCNQTAKSSLNTENLENRFEANDSSLATELETSDNECEIILVIPNDQEDCETVNDKSLKDVRSKSTDLAKDLQGQYVNLFENILIPKDKFDFVTDLIDMLESEFQKTVPWCNIVPFRHWYLGINNCGNNELLLFFDYRRVWEEDKWGETSCRKPEIISTFFRSPQKIFPDITKLPKIIKDSNQKHQTAESFGVGFLHRPTGIKFRVITSVIFLHEVQTCLLAKYLCQFDLNALPLLGLVNYWAKLNSLSFGNLLATNPSNTPLPASLDWLVLLFLMNRKGIPSVRDILQQPHDELIFCDKDIGFSSSPEFPKMWLSSSTEPLQVNEQLELLRNTDESGAYSVNNILSMLEILREFFSFFGRYRSSRVRKRELILNTKDGNVIKKSAVFKPGKCSQTLTFSEEELETLRTVDCLTSHQVSILHPIDLRFSLSFCGEKFAYLLTHAMQYTSKKLAKFFRNLKRKRKVNAEESINLIELLKVDKGKLNKKVGTSGKVKTGKNQISKKTKTRRGKKKMEKLKNKRKLKKKKNATKLSTLTKEA